MLLRWYHVFFITFAAALIIQTWIWQVDSFTDESVWVERLEHFVPNKLTADDLLQKRYSSTPGTVALLLGRIFLRAGISPLDSLRFSVALLVSLATAGVAAAARAISPDTWWWLAAAVIMSTHPLYLQASPVDAVASALMALITIVFLWYRHCGRQASRSADIGFGILMATAFATRFHLALILVVPSLILIGRVIGAKRSMFIFAVALAGTFGLNPFLGYLPGTYVRVGGLEQLGFFTGSQLEKPLHRSLPADSLLFTPFAALSVLLAHVLVLLPPWWPDQPTDRRFLQAMLAVTGVTVVVLLSSALQSLRYFSPLILIWEIFLPLFLFSLIRRRLQLAGQILVVVLTAGSTVFLLLYSMIQ